MRILSVDDAPFHEIVFLEAGPGGGVQTQALPISIATVDALPPNLTAILVASDLQGREMPRSDGMTSRLLGEVLAEELEVLADLQDIPPPEHIGVLLAGDLYAPPKLDRRGIGGDVRPVWRAFASRFRWVAGVAGNHDDFGGCDEEAHSFAHEPGIHVIDDGLLTVDSLQMVGIAGIIGRSDKLLRRSETVFAQSLRALLHHEPEIVLLHQGPDVPAEGLLGHPVVRDVLTARQSGKDTLVICGHVHWQTPLASLPGNNQVLNVDGRALLLKAVQ